MLATSTGKRWFIHNLATVQLASAQTGGAYGLVEFVGRQGDMPPLHVHRREDEAFYVLDGRMTVFVGSEEIGLEAGECALAPRDVPHVYRVESGEARWLALASPGGFDRFVLEASDPAETDELPPPGRVPDAERVGAVAAAHGIEILGPPGMLPAEL